MRHFRWSIYKVMWEKKNNRIDGNEYLNLRHHVDYDISTKHITSQSPKTVEV